MPKHYRPTPEHLKFFQENAQIMTQEQLRIAINEKFNLALSPWHVGLALRKNNWSQGSNLFAEAHLQFLRENYPLLSRKELTSKLNEKFDLNMTEQQITAAVKNHKIRSGRKGFFVKGQQSWNAGRKGLTKPNSGMFRLGSLPPNVKPLWSERIDEDGFIWIKVPEPNPYTKAATRYIHKHIYLWEQANGPIPEGHAVIFVDSDKSNCCIENLDLVTKAELLRLNKIGYKHVPEEYKPTARIIAKLDVTAFQLQRKLKVRR